MSLQFFFFFGQLTHPRGLRPSGELNLRLRWCATIEITIFIFFFNSKELLVELGENRERGGQVWIKSLIQYQQTLYHLDQEKCNLSYSSMAQNLQI